MIVSILTCNLQSVTLLYGSRSGLRFIFPSVILLAFRQSKNLSKTLQNSAVSSNSSFPSHLKAELTDELNTRGIDIHNARNKLEIDNTYTIYT